MPGERVLAVDDNAVNLRLIGFLLESEGYDVRLATSAEDALAILGRFRPRLILMDVQLPGMSGLELTRRLKADPSTRDIMILALTALAMESDETRALEAGCDGYVTKPIDIDEVAGLLARILGR